MSSILGLWALATIEWCIQSPIFRVSLAVSLIIIVLILKCLERTDVTG